MNDANDLWSEQHLMRYGQIQSDYEIDKYSLNFGNQSLERFEAWSKYYIGRRQIA